MSILGFVENEGLVNSTCYRFYHGRINVSTLYSFERNTNRSIDDGNHPPHTHAFLKIPPWLFSFILLNGF